MPLVNAQSHNCRTKSSHRRKSPSYGKKRKYQSLSDVFDNTNIEDAEDQGRKTTTKFKKSKTNEDLCTRGTPQTHPLHEPSINSGNATPTSTDSSKGSWFVSPAKEYTQQSPPTISGGEDKVRRKMKKMKVAKVERKGYPSQSSKEPRRGILRNTVKSKFSRRPLFTCSAFKDRPLPDIYGDDLDRHTVQDKKVLDTLKYHQYPLDPVSPMPVGLLMCVIIEVVLLAKQEDPHIPLRSEFSDVRTAVRDKEFRKVIEACYRSGFYRDMRNHPIMRKIKVRFLDDC